MDSQAPSSLLDADPDTRTPFFDEDVSVSVQISALASEPVLETEEKDETFLQHVRERQARKLGVGAAVGAALMAAWAVLPPHIDRLLALNPQGGLDDPRLLFSQARDADAQAQLNRLLPVFSQTLPDWLEALRTARTSIGSPNALTAEETLSTARQALQSSVANDEALAAAIRNLMTLSEGELVAQEAAILEALDNLNKLCTSRQWPFRVSGRIDKEGTPLLQVRLYERVGLETFGVGSTRTPIAYYDRLDLNRAWRDPDTASVADQLAAVYTRNVTTEANGTLWATLHPSGRWRLSPVTLVIPELKALEQSLGDLVWPEWQTILTPEVSEGALKGLSSLSRQVDERNRLYRTINDRDPRRLSMPDPSAIAGAEGELRLDQLEPYAVQGRSRLTLEDITALRRWDSQLDAAMPGAAEALHVVLQELMMQAGQREVRRDALQKAPTLVAGPLFPEHSGTTAQEATAEVGASLTWLIEAPQTCRTTIATLASRSLDGAPVEMLAATDVLQRLSASVASTAPAGVSSPSAAAAPVGSQPVTPPATASASAATSATEDASAAALRAARLLPGLVNPLLTVDCPTLAQKARAVYESRFGPYEPIQRPTATLASLP